MNAADTWTTRDGRVVPVAEMTTEHLANTIKFLRRNALSMRLQVLRAMSRYIEQAPDGAAMACEAEADWIIDMSDEQFLARFVPQWHGLNLELAKRKAVTV